MHERVRVDISERASTKEFIELIEKLNKTSKQIMQKNQEVKNANL